VITACSSTRSPAALTVALSTPPADPCSNVAATWGRSLRALLPPASAASSVNPPSNGRDEALMRARCCMARAPAPDPDGKVDHTLQLPVPKGKSSAVDVQAQLSLQTPQQSLDDVASENPCKEDNAEVACLTVFLR
jgi:hypothetical protein